MWPYPALPFDHTVDNVTRQRTASPRLLHGSATPVDALAAGLRRCAAEQVAADATNHAVDHIKRLLTATGAEGVMLMPDQPGQRTDEIRLFLVNYSRALLRAL